MDTETRKQFEVVLGMAGATMMAVKALDAALTEAGVLPKGIVAKVVQRAGSEPDADHLGFDAGFRMVCDLLESEGAPPGPPEWLRGVIDGGKSTGQE